MDETEITTITQIAKDLGVSVTTVSRALNGRGKQYRISAKTESAVIAKAKELNYRPNALARGLRLLRTMTIGLVVPDTANPFFSAIAQTVTTEFRKLGYSVLLCDSQENTKLEAELIEMILHHQVDGIIVAPIGLQSDRIKSIASKTPIIFLDRYFDDMDIPYVATDNANSAFLGTQYLIDHGHKNIAVIQGLTNTTTNKNRIQGYCEALKANSIPINEDIIVGKSFGKDNGYIQTKLLLQTHPEITAIFALSNMIGLGAIDALNEEHIDIPNDISLICFDDSPYFNYMSTPITSIAQQPQKLAQIAVVWLHQIMHSSNKKKPSHLLLPGKLIERSSVKNLNL